jgi:DNA-binding GntR family transcriptional regulator
VTTLPFDFGRIASQDEASDPRKWVQIAVLIRSEINGGMIPPGSAISITDLHERTKAARQTCAKALSLLEHEGIVTRFPGFGYHVNEVKETPEGTP